CEYSCTLVTAHAAPCLCHPLAQPRRGPARGADAARARRYLHHPDLYACGQRAAEKTACATSSTWLRVSSHGLRIELQRREASMNVRNKAVRRAPDLLHNGVLFGMGSKSPWQRKDTSPKRRPRSSCASAALISRSIRMSMKSTAAPRFR